MNLLRLPTFYGVRQRVWAMNAVKLSFPILPSFFLLTLALTGCGSSSSPNSSGLTGNTSVTLIATSTANDQLSEFLLSLTSLTLTNQAGATVNIVPSPQSIEFMHLNGAAEPIVTTTIPQGVYTSATAIVGGAQFVCAGFNSSQNELQTSTYAYGQTPPAQVSVTLSPITITGTAMGLSLDMLVSKSATFSACAGPSTYAINPTFSLAPITFAAQPTNNTNGKFTALSGLITSLSANGACLTVTAADGPVFSADCNSSTIFQGVSGVSALTTGLPVSLDAVTQSDGSLLATRIAVQSTNTSDLNIWNGQMIAAYSSTSQFFTVAREQYGYLSASANYVGGQPFSFGSATFQISSQLSNLESLPFTPSFTATNLVAGQTVSVTTNVTGPQLPFAASTIQLIPQTLDGTITSISTSGSFTTYSITLAPYDLFPDLVILPGQVSTLNTPNTVTVYIDTNTELLNTTVPAVGTLLRFTGLVFNDNGTLRMDCAQINNGVAE